VIRTGLSGYDLLTAPGLNKGRAFSEQERDAFALHGLVPPHQRTLDHQLARRKRVLEQHLTLLKNIAFCAICRM
jgi:malate dehydrogenase (oxaloacetate-decarboxylating)